MNMMNVMKRSRLLLVVLTVLLPGSLASQAQSPATPKPATKTTALPAGLTPTKAALITKRVEQYLRNIYAWGSEFDVQAGPVSMSPTADLYEVPVKVSLQGQSDTASVYVSKDGRYMFRGELQDLNTDPLAAIRRELKTQGFAAKGPANAKVTVVEFADFQCPVCRQLEFVLRAVMPKYPQVRFVFEDFPLDSVHPWATKAAIAGHCALQQSPDLFWKFHDSIYDNQDQITVANASTKLEDLAIAAGADLKSYQACIADPQTAEAVKKSSEQGRMLHVTGTPTVFVNGRRFVGPDQASLEQFIQFDLGDTKTNEKEAKP